MKFVFDEKISDFLKRIAEYASENGAELYFVGGIVRDNVLQRPLNDIDLIVNTNAIEFSKNLPSDFKIKSIHPDFATVKVFFNDFSVDIASTRTEHYPFRGCLPVVDKIGVDIKEDFKRRDFSVNALYCKIHFCDGLLKYELFDFTNGVDDIDNKILRVLHNKSYLEDPTRILRGVDFKHRFNFDFSEYDKILIKEALTNEFDEHSSTDRILSVFKKILNRQTFQEIINEGYYKLINKNDITVDFDLLNKLPFKPDSEFFLDVINNHRVEKLNFKSNCDIFKEFSKYSDSKLAYYFYKTKDNNVYKFLKFKDTKLFTTGNDLKQLGFSEGKKIGEILNFLFEEKLKYPQKFNAKIDEISWVKQNFIK